MTRAAPLTLDDVDAARRELVAAGIPATTTRVIAKLGRGSNTTIVRHLRTLAAREPDAATGALPDPVREALCAASEAVWNEIASAADARIEAIRTDAARRIDAAVADRDAAVARASDAGDRAGTLLVERDAARTQLDELGTAHGALSTDHVALERRHTGLEATHAGLVDRLADRDAELECVRMRIPGLEADLVAATNERDRLAAEDAARTAALVRATEVLDAERARGAVLVTEAARLSAELDANRTRAETQTRRLDDLHVQHAETREQAAALGAGLVAARHESAVTSRELDAARRTIDGLHVHAGALQARLENAVGLASDAETVPDSPDPDGETGKRTG